MKMNRIVPLLLSVLLICYSCDSLDYKYADEPDIVLCEDLDINTNLLKEALYNFENELKERYTRNPKTVLRGYTNYLNAGLSGTIPHESSVSQHTRDIFDLLKKEEELWTMRNGKYQFNYNSDLMACISNNIADKDLQTTFKALLDTNSMTSRTIGWAIYPKLTQTRTDRYLATFIALDMYYARLFEVKFTETE